MTVRPLIPAVSSTDKGMRGDLGHRVDIRFFVRPREGVGDEIGFTLYVSDVGCKLSNIRELILLFDGLWVRFFVDRGDQALMIGIKGEWSPFDHRLEMPNRLVGGQKLAFVRRPLLLISGFPG